MNILNIKRKLPLVLAISMLTATAAANKTQEAYQAGHLAMAQQKWSQAQEQFAAASSDKSLADSATYWQAYVLYQNNRHGEAKLLVKKLLKEYPKSQWADDAQMLLLENLATFSNIESALGSLHMSRATLYRKLKDEGATFSQLVKQARLDKLRSLKSTTLSNEARAEKLGFSDVSSYYRFIKQ